MEITQNENFSSLGADALEIMEPKIDSLINMDAPSVDLLPTIKEIVNEQVDNNPVESK